jgi:pyruvate carboxylase subunit B
MGADEICLKDMAGIGRPVSLGKIVKNIKTRHPHIPMQYHGHAAPGFQMASILEVAQAGIDYVDVAMEPLSWGTAHADVLAVQAMLKDAGFSVPEINMKAYMKVRSLTQSFIDDFLGYYINPKNRLMNSLLIGPGLPGGMMGSLMADLENNLESLNRWLLKNGKEELTLDDLLLKLFDEVAYIWPKVGYPPLVTPFSQYVKNLALMNVIQMEKGKERWSIIADNIWDMILGKSGKLPGEVAPELVELAKEQGKEFYTGNPQDLYPDQLDEFRAEMKRNNWDFGQDDEELFELAMHPEQYRAYKSGEAKAAFEKDLAEKKAAAKQNNEGVSSVSVQQNDFKPKKLIITIDDEEYEVNISYADDDATENKEPDKPADDTKPGENPSSAPKGKVKELVAPLEGKFFFTKDPSEKPIKVGDKVKKGDVIGYIESMKTYNTIAAEEEGTVVEICVANGDPVYEDDVIIKLQ